MKPSWEIFLTGGAVPIGDGATDICENKMNGYMYTAFRHLTGEGNKTRSATVLISTLFILLFCQPTTISAQDQSLSTESQVQKADSVRNQTISSGFYEITENEFTGGLNLTIPEMVQGRIPGISFYKRGDDPNGSFTYRIRGLSSLQGNNPLYVVDGVLFNSPELIEPYDIKSIRFLSDVTATAAYGFRGSSGVIEITTKGRNYPFADGNSQRVNVEYNGYLALSSKAKQVSVMNREQYLAADGVDLGSDTDWQDLVSRRALTHTNHMSISGGNENTSYRLSGTIRRAEGILLQSGFEQINGRAGITHRALDQRLELKLNLASANRKSDFSFAEGFRYAAVSNPTSPVKFDNGNYYQPILFDNFNPHAILELNTNEGQSKILSINSQAAFDVTNHIQLSAIFGQEFNEESTGEFYPDNSFFRGLNRGGLARRSFSDADFRYIETRGSYTNTISDKITLVAVAGYSFQEFFREEITMELGNLPSNELGYYAIDLSSDRIIGGPGNILINSYATPDERIVGFFGQLSVNFNQKFFIDASLRREGSTRLGTNSKWGLFPALSIGMDITDFWKTDLFSQLTGRLGYGRTGTLPVSPGLSLDRYEYFFNEGGSVRLVQEANPDLKWENKRELNFGLDFGMMDSRLTGSLNLYQINISDFILETRGSTFITAQYQNEGEIRTRGWDVSLNYIPILRSNFQWNTGLIVSRYKSKLIDYINDEGMFGSPGAPGGGSGLLVKYAVGEELGQIWGPLFSGEVDEFGRPVFVDINKDGRLLTNFGFALNEDSDFTNLGNAIPDIELGWTHSVSYKSWTLNTLIRGVFGHSLVNLNRLFYEPVDPGAISSYNRIITDKAVEGLTVSRFSSLYVERADFVKLDYLTISRRFNLNSIEAIGDVTVFLTVENVFTITGYTGISPEPVLEDRGPTDNGSRLRGDPNRLTMGIDRRTNYLPARSFIFGVNLKF